MTHEDFDRLVSEVQNGIGRDLNRLRRRVVWLAILGYAGILASLGIVALCSAAFIVPGIIWFRDAWMMLLIGLILLAIGSVAFFREVVVRSSKIEHFELTREMAPALFDMLDQLRESLRSARFHNIYVIPDCNAAVVQRPILGPLGMFRNSLLIGWPLLENFFPDEFRAIMAHEFTHLARAHGKSSQWIYRLRRSWEQQFPRLASPRIQGEISLRPLIRRFVEWFWPRFNAHAFVLSRVHEYEADSSATKLAGTTAAATALVRVNLYGCILEKEFWPELWRTSADAATPPGDVMQRAGQFLAERLPAAQSRLVAGFHFTTTNSDTHPCLSDRLRAISVLPEASQNYSQAALRLPAKSAGAEYLGPSADKIRAGVQQNWQMRHADQWRQLHAKAGSLQYRLGGIEQVALKSGAGVDALWDKAHVILQLEGERAAIPLLKEILALQPRHARANLALGEILLHNDDAQGERYIESALADDDGLLPDAADALHGFYRRSGQEERIRQLYSRLDQHEKSAIAAAQERQNVSAADTFCGHGLPPEQLEALRRILENEDTIQTAWLVQKEFKHYSRQRLYLLSIRIRPAWHRFPNTAKEQAAVGSLVAKVKLPGRLLVFGPRGAMRGVSKKMERQPDALIYRRAR